ncbi:ras association domain-containing protein 6 [Bufo gargarizans]|uniref:ras association domain-containing protein 6 n=1 Tax=Bufo gargarizans TaxID=30331 RepID=UPI001CF3B46F|nr:ras association domain-containing protein 6 [Bufo gargarizans]XP_044158852.1 ras association domain-containing protein 6 [Bufo gargarizans]XP_044158860.1 ras association domain-containing protein 6 [Bufo gargarizans]
MAKNSGLESPLAFIKDSKNITRGQLDSLLKSYNCYFKEKKNLQITYHRNDSGQIVLSGLIEIFWGVQRPIRFQMQDEKCVSTESIQLPEVIGSSITKSGMMRWGEFDDLYHIAEIDEPVVNSDELNSKDEYGKYEYDTTTLRPNLNDHAPDSPSLYRTMSDATLVRKRIRPNTPDRAHLQQHRFSINGHFYNFKTSIFTPTFGSETKVMINSNMKTKEVIEQLLHKFKIETSPNEFALYIIHASGEKKKLKSTDCPLWERLLQGPSGNIARMFLMDREAEEISSDVAQYIKFSLPLLETILQRLNDEEEREIQRTIAKYIHEKSILRQCLNSKTAKKTETTV